MKLKEYMNNSKKVAEFGIKYLDDKLKGILKGDLILLGARSGAGKSTIADIIATHNAKKGVKVTLISLENFEGDNFVAKAYYKYKELTKNYWLTIREFASGEFKINEQALQEAEDYANKQYENIYLINRQKDYTIEKLKEDIVGAACNPEKKSELVIIDHIDYLDKDADTHNEIDHITKLVRTIRNAQYTFKVPVIAISHLRKSSLARDNVIIPGDDEFIGSSNKVKESTCVIVLAPDEKENIDTMCDIRFTWCCIRKLRMGGFDYKAAQIAFNTKTGLYEPNYKEFKVNYSGTKVEEIPDKFFGFPG